MKRLLLALGLLFSTTQIFPSIPLGTLDSTFNPSASYAPNGQTYGMSTISGVYGIVTTDISGAGSIDNAYACAVQEDGKLVVVGSTSFDRGTTVYFAIVRYNTDGSLDSTFGTGGIQYTNILGSDIAYGVAIQNDGKIVVVGTDGINFVVARYTSVGQLDTTGFNSSAGGEDNIAGIQTYNFTGSSTDTAYSVAIQNNGKIVVAGASNQDGPTKIALLRLNTDGSVDTSFGSSGQQALSISSPATIDIAQAVVIDGNGKIVICGKSHTSLFVARFTSAGLLDSYANDHAAPFGSGSAGSQTGYTIQAIGTAAVAYGLGLQSTGKIVVCGKNSSTAFVARFTTAGLLDSYANDHAAPFGTGSAGSQTGYNQSASFGGSNPAAYDLVIDPLDNITIAGTLANSSFLIAQYLNDGTALNSTFGVTSPGYTLTANSVSTGFSGTTEAKSIALLPTGNYMIAGYSDINSYDFAVVRYVGLPASGTINENFNTSGTDKGFINLYTELDVADVPTTPSEAKVMLQLSGGAYLVATDDGVNTYINMFTDDDIVTTSGFGSSGLLTISGKAGVSCLFVDQAGDLLVVGPGWIEKYDLTGAPVGGFAITQPLSQNNSFAQQSNGRYIVAGSEGFLGALVAYNSVTGAVDTTFGNQGSSVVGPLIINSIAIDAYDNIFGIHNDGSSNPILFVVDLNGHSVTSTSAGDLTGGSYSCDTTSNHLVIDNNGDIVVISAMSVAPYPIFMSRYSYNGSSLSLIGSQLTLSAGSTGLTQPIVTSLIVAENGKFIVTGYDAANSVPFVMRVKSDLSNVDTLFNLTGVKITTTPIHTNDIAQAWYDAIITPHGKIIVAGYAAVGSGSTVNTPYLMSLNGDPGVAQYLTTQPIAGTPGTIDTNFNHYVTYYPGGFELANLGSGALTGATPTAFLPQSYGGHFIAFNNGKVIKITNDNALDVGNWSMTGIAVNSVPAGAQFMMQDGLGRLVVVGTTGGAGWIARYNNDNPGTGTFDATFNGGAYVSLGSTTVATNIVEQSCGRLVVAGQNAAGHGTLFGLTNSGAVDTTFGTNGVYDTGSVDAVYALVCDEYDRLIFAYAGTDTAAVITQRLTASGELDTTFGVSNIIGGGGVIDGANESSQVRLAFDASNNIVVAAFNNTSIISVVAYDAATGRTNTQAELDISGFTNPTLTGLVTTSDGYVLVSGYQGASGYPYALTTNDMFVARVENSSGSYVLDTTFAPAGSIAEGIMDFAFNTSLALGVTHTLTAIALYGDGEISMIGQEFDGSNINPFLARAYSNPAAPSQTIQTPNSKGIGTNDGTFGVSTLSTTDFGILFYGASGDAESGQIAQAVAMQDNNNIVIAIDGGVSADIATPTEIMLNMFDVDGLATSFGSHTVTTGYESYGNQHVKDMMLFTTGGVHKAIIAGYVVNSTPSITNSLLIQYNVSTPGLDTSFGGFESNLTGSSCGDAQTANVVGRQSNGRIVIGATDQSNCGLLVGYTPAGQLDFSFGMNGLVSQGTGTAGVYSHAIDSQDRIVVAYTDSGLNNVYVSRFLPDGSSDHSFNTTGTIDITFAASSASNVRVAIDASNNVFVAACTATGITIYNYAASNGALINSLTPSISLTSFTIARMLIDLDGNVVIVGSDVASPNQIVVLRALNNLTNLDTTFNGTGYLKYAVAGGTTTQLATDALIHNDGRIIIVGAEA